MFSHNLENDIKMYRVSHCRCMNDDFNMFDACFQPLLNPGFILTLGLVCTVLSKVFCLEIILLCARYFFLFYLFFFVL